MSTLTPPPTQAGYLTWLREVVGISVDALPDDSIYIQLSYDRSVATVLPMINCVDPFLYMECVYNLATSFLINSARDQSGGPKWPGSDPVVGYWTGLRQSLGCNSFTGGVIDATSDETTSQHMLLPDFMSALTLSDLQRLKDPYGRAYLEIAQSSGSLWGVS